jgi:hypothetical protein
MQMRLQIAIILLAGASVRATGAELISSFHLDLDDCDDVAADSHSLYFACHSAHAPSKAPASPPNMDAYVAKLDRHTGKILYLTRLGGEGVDIAIRIKIDAHGRAYVTGFTGSRDFPTTANALQRVYGGGDSDAFLTEISPVGQIIYSTYIGGSQADQADGIALSPDGVVWIAGRTWSADFPHVKRKFGARGKSDIFVTRLKPGDPTVHSSMILGGSGEEKLTGIAVADNSVFVTGYTESANFPVIAALKPRLGGSMDAFLASIEDGFESIKFSTYLGATGDDSSWGIALDPQGNPVVAGITTSDDLPTTKDAGQKHRSGQADAFLMKVDKSGQKLLLSTYYGGSGLDHAGYDGVNVVVSSTGNIWMVGLTNSRDLLVPGAYHPHYGGGEQDGFVIAFSPGGKLCYGTYAGGTARYLFEGVTLADRGTTVYAVGTVIRPVNKDSPTPDQKEKYGMFVVGLRTDESCR